MTDPLLSVCIATRDRPADLVRCLNSLRHLDGIDYEVLVTDDGSAEPVESIVRAGTDPQVLARLTAVRNDKSAGYLAGRNQMPRRARGRYLMVLDDDAFLLDGTPIRRGVEILDKDPKVGAVAYAQGDLAGNAYTPSMQPSQFDVECIVPCYYGYAHLLRRDLFLELGGYPEEFEFFCEEEEFGKRMVNRGAFVVYVPRPAIPHDTFSRAAGRNSYRRIHNGCRNKCFDALLNEPWLMALVTVPLRLYGYARWVRHLSRSGEHPGLSPLKEVFLVAREVLTRFPRLLRQRRCLRWSTYRIWHRKLKSHPAYRGYVPSDLMPSPST